MAEPQRRAATKLTALLRRHRFGNADPTIVISATDFWRAVRTPDGPGTLHLSVTGQAVSAEAFGPGAGWLLATVDQLIGRHDDVPPIQAHHPAVAKALHRHGTSVMSVSRVILPTLIASILGQRVTTGEAIHQWASLCRLSNEPAPGPQPLLLPPDPLALSDLPYWEFHQRGIERSRADTIINVCRRANRVEEVAGMSIADGYRRLLAFPGVGLWTAASTMWVAMGDPDAVAVGDFHLKNVVSYALANEPRGTDDRMLELLSPYAGQRGRVVEALVQDGWSAPKYGPRQPIRSMARW